MFNKVSSRIYVMTDVLPVMTVMGEAYRVTRYSLELVGNRLDGLMISNPDL